MSAGPNGWADTVLGEVVEVLRPRSDPSGNPGLPFVGMDNVEAHTMRLLATVDASTMKSAAVHFLPGDVLYGRLRPYLNKVFQPTFEGLASAEFIPLTAVRGVSPDFVRFRINAADFVAFASRLDEGDRPRVDWQGIREFEISLPPSPEQDRIVEAIDSYLSRLDDAVANLERVRIKLKAYRASVLKVAVEGRLVPTEAEVARQERRRYEPAEELLKRILKERRQRWEQTELAKLKAAGKAPKDDKWKAKYEEPPPPDTTQLPALPEGWCWVTLPQIGELNRGKSKHRPRNHPRLLGGKYPFVQTGDIRRADTWLRDYEATYSDFGLAQSRLWPAGTMCITIAANIAETAILAMDACFPDSVVGFLQEDPVVTRYVEMFIRTARQRLHQYAPATAQKNINLDTLSRVAVPLPPHAEQLRLVTELDRLLSLAAQVASAAEDNGRRCGRLRQAVLKWAFEGKLVDQNAADEAAEQLLDRIRAARTTKAPIGKARGRKVKAAS